MSKLQVLNENYADYNTQNNIRRVGFTITSWGKFISPKVHSSKIFSDSKITDLNWLNFSGKFFINVLGRLQAIFLTSRPPLQAWGEVTSILLFKVVVNIFFYEIMNIRNNFHWFQPALWSQEQMEPPYFAEARAGAVIL